jgi:hypothetical protein
VKTPENAYIYAYKENPCRLLLGMPRNPLFTGLLARTGSREHRAELQIKNDRLPWGVIGSAQS